MNAAAFAHLSPAARSQALLPDNERIRAMQRDRWVDYPRAAEARQWLERLLGTPERERMPCMVIHGESNIGNTLVVRKLQREHPTTFDDVRGVERRQIVAMQMPATPGQHRFYSALLFELGAPHNTSAGLSTLERLSRDLLRRIAPRMLVVDEVHHLLAGSFREQRASLSLLKYLANDLRLSIVLVGTSDAPIALQTDAQMSSRFLAVFGKLLPRRKASELADRAVVQFMLAASSGLTGDVVRILNEAAELAIRDGTESVTLAHLEHVAKISA
ncbi:TniB family NTP-binding protein [Variovorax sp. RT4R15]|uniref:TniB family NTP-binding protein n=1 Tax=Variovorax sp. RT4R15 TaxID=3443737 RepID=UPI003F467811